MTSRLIFWWLTGLTWVQPSFLTDYTAPVGWAIIVLCCLVVCWRQIRGEFDLDG